jgi:hypothetical protein
MIFTEKTVGAQHWYQKPDVGVHSFRLRTQLFLSPSLIPQSFKNTQDNFLKDGPRCVCVCEQNLRPAQP